MSSRLPSKAVPPSTAQPNSSGFTLIELMIVIAVIAILISIAIPVYTNYTVRAKIGEGIAVAKAAKTATGVACQEDRTLTNIANSDVGYSFTENSDQNAYVQSIEVSGECAAPVIEITTKNTGAPQLDDPVIELLGDFSIGGGQVTWDCASSNTPNHLLPKECRT